MSLPPSKLSPPLVYRYSSYLDFLQDAYQRAHAENAQFSYEHIAEISGLRSRTQAKNFIKGVQNPSVPELERIAAALGVTGDETRYLVALYQFQRASTRPVALDLFEKLLQMQRKHPPGKNPFREIEIATSTLHLTLLSLLGIPEISQATGEIVRRLKHRYTASQIEAALTDLADSDRIRRSGPGERWVVAQDFLRTYDFETNLFLQNYHAECLRLAQTSLETEPPSERYLVGANFRIPEKSFPRIVQKLNAFLENLMQLEGLQDGPETVIQISAQCLKLSESGPGPSATERAFDPSNPFVIADKGTFSAGDLPLSERSL